MAGRRSRDTAILLTRIAEIDQRQIYRRAGYSSLYAYLLGELHLLEDSACRHIHASRLARRFPALLIAMFEHRLHMRAVMMLAPHLTPGNADELVAAASHKTRALRVRVRERERSALHFMEGRRAEERRVRFAGSAILSATV